MINPSSRLSALGLLSVTLALAARAENYSIDSHTIAGGGGTSTGGVYSVSGTIGQPDAGTMSGGNYSVAGGFWGGITVLQSPGAPRLTISPAGTNAVVSWPSPSTGFTLQQNANVANTNGWVNYGGSVADDGTVKSATVPANAGKLFFRLNQ